MPFNGSGTFVPLSAPNYPAVAGTLITASASNANLADIFSGLSNCITRNGQSPATANIPMAGYKLTGLGAATGAGDAVRFEQAFLASGANPITGSVTFSGTGLRILGDFSNATLTNRLTFQSSTVNGGTIVQHVPNGAGTFSGVAVYNTADPTNSALGLLQAASADVRLASAISGAGAYLPLTLHTGGGEAVRIHQTTRNVLINTATDNGSDKLQVAGGINTTSGLSMSGSGFVFSFAGGAYGSVRSGIHLDGTNQVLAFYTAAGEAARVSSTRNVLIGTTTDNGTHKLQVNGAILAAASTTSVASMNLPHGTAPTSPVNGDLWTTSSGAFVRINGTTKTITSSTSLARLTSGVVKTTLSAVSGLDVAVEANTRYKVTMALGVSTNCTGINFGFSGPTGMTGLGGTTWVLETGGTPQNRLMQDLTTSTSTVTSGINYVVVISGYVKTSGTAGNLNIQMGISAGTDFTVLEGSWIEVTKTD